MITRENAIAIFMSGVAEVQPANLIPRHLSVDEKELHIFEEKFSLNNLPDFYVIGAGKASAAMAQTVEAVLGENIKAGLVITKTGHALPLKNISCLQAPHPLPGYDGVEATLKTIELLEKVKENDCIICLISGGASSLWIDIPEGLNLSDIRECYQQLLYCGANIEEMNTVRKHLSAIKGGQLLRHAPAAKWFSFLISDVPDDDLSVIASGPTVPDNSTFQEVQTILEKYHLAEQIPAAIFNYIEAGCRSKVNETLKPGDPVFNQVQNKIIGSNSMALKAAAAKAIQLGYHIAKTDFNLKGDAATVARELIDQAIHYSGNLPACILLGGETTVAVTGKGLGGRNQHMALSALDQLNKREVNKMPSNNITFLSAGTDGTDGPTDAAGAIADAAVLKEALERNLNLKDYLSNNDAFHFFEQTGGLLKTGPTQTNVMDLVVMIIA